MGAEGGEAFGASDVRGGAPMLSLTSLTGTKVRAPRRQKPSTLCVTFLINKRGGSSYMGVGLAEKDMVTCKYLGNDQKGWMMINDGRKGHNNQWVRYGYNVAMKAGDLIGIEFDRVEGTVRFNYNGHDLGVAFNSLQNKVLYPAVTFANTGDSVTIVDAGIANYGWSEEKLHEKMIVSADRLTVTALQGMSSGGSAVAVGEAKDVFNPYGEEVDPKLMPCVPAPLPNPPSIPIPCTPARCFAWVWCRLVPVWSWPPCVMRWCACSADADARV